MRGERLPARPARLLHPRSPPRLQLWLGRRLSMDPAGQGSCGPGASAAYGPDRPTPHPSPGRVSHSRCSPPPPSPRPLSAPGRPTAMLSRSSEGRGLCTPLPAWTAARTGSQAPSLVPRVSGILVPGSSPYNPADARRVGGPWSLSWALGVTPPRPGPSGVRGSGEGRGGEGTPSWPSAQRPLGDHALGAQPT